MAETNFQKIVRILVKPMNRLEEAAQQNALMRFVYNATGVTLTYLGLIVGQEREGVTDDDIFRRYVSAKISVNSSDGTGEEMYNISKLIITEPNVTFALVNHGVAAFTVRVNGAGIPWAAIQVLIKLLRRAANAGVRVLIEWNGTDPANGFRFAKLDLSAPAVGKGFANFAGTDGGKLASAVE